MIQFISKHGNNSYDFTKYDDDDLIRLCGQVSCRSKEARKELNNYYPFAWLYNFIDDLMESNNKFYEKIGWIMIILFNPILIVIWLAGIVIGIIAIIYQLTH